MSSFYSLAVSLFKAKTTSTLKSNGDVCLEGKK